jgi:histidinol-phosphatase
MKRLLEAVQEVARLAGDVALGHYRAALTVETKPDGSPVTIADRGAEQAARVWLASRFPDDGIEGEEFGESAGTSGRRWIIDPIDGTKNYVRGVPVWGALIGLEVDGEIVAGVVSAPALGRRWWAAKGEGAYADGRPISVSKVAGIGDAFLSHASLEGWSEIGRAAQFDALARKVWRTRGFGDFWQHMMVAEGAVDAAVEPSVEVWDIAALKIIVEEAGGRLTDLTGAARVDGGNAVSSNGLLHDDLVAALG